MTNYPRRRRANRDKQLELFTGSAPASNGPPSGRETMRLYGAVLFLRIYAGCNVWKAGREHLVAGRQVTTAQLMQLAQAETRRICGNSNMPDYALHRLGLGPRPADYPAA
jgi:hypothetical protein